MDLLHRENGLMTNPKFGKLNFLLRDTVLVFRRDNNDFGSKSDFRMAKMNLFGQIT